MNRIFMKIYFTASIVGKKHYLENYLKIIDILHKMGHEVTSDHIIKVSDDEINLQTELQRERFHKQLKKWIMNCQAMVVETSFPSISVGFEISLALSLGKPVLLLHTNEAPTLLSSYDDEKLICEKYTSGSLKDIITDFINYAEGTSDSRFTFFITTRIANFLDEISRSKKIPKSVYVRHLIEKEMA